MTALSIMSLRLFTIASRFVLALFIARFMGLDDLGFYGLVAGVTVVAPLVLNFGLTNSTLRAAVNKPPSELAALLVRLWRMVGVIYVLGAAVMCLLPLPTWMWLVWGITLLEHVNQDAYVLMVNRHRAMLANILLFLRAAAWIWPFMLISSTTPAWLEPSMLFAVWLGGNVLSFFGFAYVVRGWGWRQAFHQPWDIAWYACRIRTSWKLFISELATALGQYADRYLIGLFLSLELVGVYVLFWQMGNALYNLAQSGVMQVVRPHLITAFQAEDESHFRKLLTDTFARVGFGMLVSGGVLWAAMPHALPYLQRPLAVAYVPLLGIILLGNLIRALGDVVALGLFTRNHDHGNMVAAGVLVGLVVAGNLLVTPTFGLYGAGWVYAGSLFVALGIRGYVLAKQVRTS